MATPRLPEKRWSIDLEKKIQEEHYADESVYQNRYGFKPDSGKPLFVIDTPPPYPSGRAPTYFPRTHPQGTRGAGINT